MGSHTEADREKRSPRKRMQVFEQRWSESRLMAQPVQELFLRQSIGRETSRVRQLPHGRGHLQPGLERLSLSFILILRRLLPEERRGRR